MIFNVEMLAFGDGEIREVDVPNDRPNGNPDNDLELIFHFGQNDFQNKPHPSVSAGDVIHYKNNKYVVAGIGFKQMSDAEYKGYLNIQRHDRNLLAFLYKKSQTEIA